MIFPNHNDKIPHLQMGDFLLLVSKKLIAVSDRMVVYPPVSKSIPFLPIFSAPPLILSKNY